MNELGTWTGGGVAPSKSNRLSWDAGTIPWLASMDVSAATGPVRMDGIRGRLTEAAINEPQVRIVRGPSVAVVMRSNALRCILPLAYNNLSSGLPVEIKARRQQYAHYRDRLLSFEEVSV